MLEIRGNISYFILRSTVSVVTSSPVGDEAYLAKMYPAHICPYPGWAVRGWIKYESPNIHTKLVNHCLPTWKSVWHSVENVKQYQLFNTVADSVNAFDNTTEDLIRYTTGNKLWHICKAQWKHLCLTYLICWRLLGTNQDQVLWF